MQHGLADVRNQIAEIKEKTEQNHKASVNSMKEYNKSNVNSSRKSFTFSSNGSQLLPSID